MKKIFICILLLQCIPFTHAEKGLIKEKIGDLYTIKKADTDAVEFENALKVDMDHYVISKRSELQYVSVMFSWLTYTKPSDFVIYKLDKSMNVVAVVTLPSEIQGKSVQSFSLKKFGDKICALFYFNNQKSRRQYLFAQQFNKTTLKKEGDIYKIGEATINNREKRIACLFRVDVNSDESKMLITADRAYLPLTKKQKKTAKAEKVHTFAYWLLDTSYHLIKGNRYTKLGKGHTIVVGQTFDNEGNICFLGLESDKAVKPRKNSRFNTSTEGTDRSRSRLIMKIIRPDNSDVEISFAKGQYFYSAMMKLNPNTGNVAVVGLMVSGKYGANGIFSQQVNLKSGEVLVESISKFGSDFVKQISNQKGGVKNDSKKKKPKKEKKAPANADYVWRLVRLGACFYNEDNELVVVAQKLHTYTITNKTGRGSSATYTTTTYYVYGDVIAFKLDESGKVNEFGFMPHYHESTTDSWRDYAALFTGKKLCIVNGINGCEIKFENKSYTPDILYRPEGFSKDNIYISTINISDNAVIQILRQNLKLNFVSLYVKEEEQ